MKTNKILAITASAILVFSLAVSSSAEINAAKQLGDVNGDGVIDTADALEIMQYSVGKKTEFSAERTLGAIIERENINVPYQYGNENDIVGINSGANYRVDDFDKLLNILYENIDSVDVAAKYGLKKQTGITVIHPGEEAAKTTELYLSFSLKQGEAGFADIEMIKDLASSQMLLQIETETQVYAYELTEKQVQDAIQCIKTEYEYIGETVLD